ncbi:ATP-dependent RNA helicase RhlE [Gottschalkia purinilytica]|uniref:ATP-dependent RNA helicase RhlE n=1 Tax=Gottschalkia purinilytica TaxID=1503 RepID=A0A0L0W846_GOTPU|nr:DEAD/DEAH box helicase [Gottschalkia purinilytica]KNF07719.1 ATP-dependent RNA helicase RhlE [Gottschalkia purinilytica]
MTNITFNNLGFNKDILKAIGDMGFEEPSKIQGEVIPVILQGFDVIGQAQTGTGKTLAFGGPIINNLNKSSDGRVSAIILTPTRELAIQINDELIRIAKYSNVSILPVYGGQSIDRQIKALKKQIDIVVGTPGRVLDLIRRRILKLSGVEFLVLDEADEMLNMGFIEDIEKIMESCNSDRQTLLFSATLPSRIKKIAKGYMKPDAKHISIIKNQMTVSSVEQYYYEIKQKDRFESLCRILDVDDPSTSIIFCKTKKGVDELVASMQARGYNVEGMHGDMSQNHRLNTLKKFKEENLDFLVATDVAARGIDVENVSHVINYDLPQDTESYVHRIGRTGRANKKGTAYTLVTSREYTVLKQIEKNTKGKIKRKEVPTIDDIFSAKYQNIVSRVKETLQDDKYKKFTHIATELDEDFSLVDVAAALISMVYEKEISYDYTENNIGSSSSYVRIFLPFGRKDKLNPKSLVNFFISSANVSKEDIGDIDILDKFTFVDISDRVAESVMKKCSGKKLCGKKVRMEFANNK